MGGAGAAVGENRNASGCKALFDHLFKTRNREETGREASGVCWGWDDLKCQATGKDEMRNWDGALHASRQERADLAVRQDIAANHSLVDQGACQNTDLRTLIDYEPVEARVWVASGHHSGAKSIVESAVTASHHGQGRRCGPGRQEPGHDAQVCST